MWQPTTLAPDGGIPADWFGSVAVPLLLPRAQDVSGCVLVAVQYAATRRANMRADREWFLHTLATYRPVRQRIRALVGGVRWRDRFHSLPGARSRESEDGEELGPSSVENGIVQARLPFGGIALIAAIPIWLGNRTTAEVGEPDRLDVDDIVSVLQNLPCYAEASNVFGSCFTGDRFT